MGVQSHSLPYFRLWLQVCGVGRSQVTCTLDKLATNSGILSPTQVSSFTRMTHRTQSTFLAILSAQKDTKPNQQKREMPRVCEGCITLLAAASKFPEPAAQSFYWGFRT